MVVPVTRDIFRLDIWATSLTNSVLEDEKFIQLNEEYYTSDFSTRMTLEEAVHNAITTCKNTKALIK